jgi:hypothetical protein
VGTPESNWKPRITFGATDASALLLDAHTKQSINELSTAEVLLRLDDSFAEPIELFAEVKISAFDDDGDTRDLFTGSVVEASPDGDVVRVRLQTMPQLTERNVPPFWSHQVDAGELIHSTLRDSGHPEERMQIQGLDEIAEEAMLAVIPIVGVDLAEQVTIGPISFVPNGEAALAYADRHVLDLVYQPLVETPVHAVFTTTARLLRDAEANAVEATDVVLAYLQLAGHCGLLFPPGGGALHFHRDDARVRPRRGAVVAVEGLSSGRCWVRVPEDRTPPLDLTLSSAAAPRLETELTLPERQALIAWRRAAAERDPVAAATALSDALEFYAAGASAPELFTEEELQALRESIPALEQHKTNVVRDAIGRLNSAPLKRRLIEATKRDGTALAPAELDFLWKRIRSARNDAVHGKGGKAPTLPEIELALSLVARLLAHRIAAKQMAI